MKPPITVVCSLYRRPEFTGKMLQALLACYGVDKVRVILSCDFDEEHKDLCERVITQAMWFTNVLSKVKYPATYFVNNPKLGIDLVKLKLFPMAFRESSYVVLLEDDTIPARDFLSYHQWASEAFKDDPTVTAVTGYHKGDVTFDPSATGHIRKVHQLYECFRVRGMNCWGTGIFKDRWEQVIGDETAYRAYAGDLVNGRFDWWWKKWIEDHGTWMVAPFVSRIQNLVGLEGENKGENANDEFAKDHFNPSGAWEIEDLPDPPNGVWQVTWEA